MVYKKDIENNSSQLLQEFLRRNIDAILQWHKFYSEKYQFVPQPVAQIPWGYNRLIIRKYK